LVEENTNMGVLFGQEGLAGSKKKWEKLVTDSSYESFTRQLAVELKRRSELLSNQDELKSVSKSSDKTNQTTNDVANYNNPNKRTMSEVVVT